MKWLKPSDLCVVTGGTNGLGAAILKEFSRRGCETVSLDINTYPDVALPKEGAASQTTVGTSGDLHSLAKPGRGLPEPVPHGCTFFELPIPDFFHCIHEAHSLFVAPGAPQTPSAGSECGCEWTWRPSLSIRCDVRSSNALRIAQLEIKRKFKRPASVLVLNAGVRSPARAVADAELSDLRDVIDVNFKGALYCMRTFIPDFIESKRGFVVSIASALGMLTPKGFSVYGASKAALIALQESLRQELKDYRGVYSLLVCPGQLDTQMFSDVTTPSKVLAPVVSPEALAQSIVARVAKARTSTLYAPTYVRFLPLLHSAPKPLADLVRKLSGVDKVYDKLRQDEEAARVAASLETAVSEHSETDSVASYETLASMHEDGSTLESAAAAICACELLC